MEDQRERSLRLANEIRVKQSEIKRELQSGEIGLREALDDPRAQGIVLWKVLVKVRGIGPERAQRAIRHVRRHALINIEIGRKVERMTPGQKDALAEAATSWTREKVVA